MDTTEIIRLFKIKVEVESEILCFTCHAGKANWLADLQDCLEDQGVSLEKFCNCKMGVGITGESFVVRRGRLRLKHSEQCVSIRHIAGILANI